MVIVFVLRQVMLPGRCLTTEELTGALRMHQSLQAALGRQDVDMPPAALHGEELGGALEVILAVLELLALLNTSHLTLSTKLDGWEELRSLSASGTRPVSLSDVLRVQQSGRREVEGVVQAVGGSGLDYAPQ